MTVKPTALPVQTLNIPADLRARPQWLLWRYVAKKKPDGTINWAKVPFQTDGRPAKSNDPKTWCSYDDAADALLFGDIPFDGIGFAFADDDGLFGIDLDDCRDPATGELTKLAEELLENVDGYAEVSPSGTGIKVFTRGQLDRARASKDRGIELYPTGRYFTVTGYRINGHNALPTADQDIGWFVQKYFNDQIRLGPSPATGGAAALEHYKPPLEGWSLERVIDEVLPHLTPECGYSDWLQVGMAMHQQSGGDADWLDAWDGWSRGSDKYIEGDCARKWNSFSRQRFSGAGAVTLATLLAKTMAQRQESSAIRRYQGGSAIYTNSPTTATCVFKLLTAEELALQRPMRWIVRHLLPENGLAVLYGQSGAGKSFLTLDLAAAIAGNSLAWFGFKVEARPVTYCVLEGENGMTKRVQAWSVHHEMPAPERLRFVAQPLDLRALGVVEQLAAAIGAAGGTGGMVVLDTLARAVPGMDENSGKEMSEVIDAAGRLQQLTGGLVLLVAHSGKADNKGPRGHSSLFAAADAVIEVRREKGQRSWKVEKSKDDADGSSFAFTLVDIDLGIDDYLEKITSCAVLPAQHLPRKKPLTPAHRLALSTLREAISARPVASSDGITGVHIDTWRPIYNRASPADKPDAKRQAFNRARNELVNAGVLRVLDDVYFISEPEHDDFFQALAENVT